MVEQRERHLHHRIEIKDGNRVFVECDRPIHLEFFDDAAYSNFPASEGWNAFKDLAEFPATIDASGPGWWNVVIRHAPGNSPQATVQVAES